MQKVALVLIFAFLLTGCQRPECIKDSDCVTPGDYLIRSNCPFTSACIEGNCAVVCPSWNYETNKSYQKPCKKDNDCTCEDYLAIDMKSCACINQNCFAVIKE